MLPLQTFFGIYGSTWAPSTKDDDFPAMHLLSSTLKMFGVVCMHFSHYLPLVSKVVYTSRYDCQKDVNELSEAENVYIVKWAADGRMKERERETKKKMRKKSIQSKLSMRLYIFSKIVCALFERWVFQPLFLRHSPIKQLQQQNLFPSATLSPWCRFFFIGLEHSKLCHV